MSSYGTSAHDSRINDASVKAFFDKKGGTWDETYEPFAQKHCDVVSFLGDIAGKTVLDVGCGTGIMMPAYIKAKAGCVLGIDLSNEMIEVAKRKAKMGVFEKLAQTDAADTKLCFMAANLLDVSDTEIASAINAEPVFDGVVLYNVYPHISDVDALVKRVFALLSSSSRFVIAHGAGRRTINMHHGASVPVDVTRDLSSVKDEAAAWEKYFDIDVFIDDEDRFVISGKKIV
ncbi:MAG: methyltransferase domain-containing protein [Eggerthellaceae bacterium]|nr:methyltransferase domain-containing protein [Eggerthellaceae bacterium]